MSDMYYTKNTNPNYYNTYKNLTNCGSFALNIKEWYDPVFGNIVVKKWIEELFEEGYSDDETADICTDMLTELILNDFSKEMRLISDWDEVDKDEELIAFRSYCHYDEFNEGWADWDFHFKVLRNGSWQEKCGSGPVRFCLEEDWSYSLRTYNSETVYFAKKISA